MEIRDFTARPAKPMRVVNKLEFVGRLERSVMRILDERVRTLDTKAKTAILRDLRHEFLAQVRHEGRRVRGTTKEDFLAELARSRDRVLEDRELARTELDKLKRRLAELRGARGGKPGGGRGAITERPAVQVPGHDLEERLRALYDVSQLAGRVPLEHEQAILEFAIQAIKTELERRGLTPENDGEVALLERRISKLSSSLANMEDKMRKLAKLKDVDPGIESEFRTVQGLNELDESFEHKKELLRDIFIANQELRDALRG